MLTQLAKVATIVRMAQISYDFWIVIYVDNDGHATAECDSSGMCRKTERFVIHTDALESYRVRLQHYVRDGGSLDLRSYR